MLQIGRPTHSVVTTCAYCGVGCSFKAEMRGEEVVRMVPWKDGKANRGHSCVKGRFAWGYSTHKDRILNPMIREKITDPWREVSWDEAFAHVASEFRRIQYQYGRGAIGGITSSRCTNEETYLVQKLVRAGLRQQQCRYLRPRLPFADRLRPEDRPSAPRPARRISIRVEQTDVVMIIGANPTDGHPVFASRLKKRLRQGAKLIVVDPRRIDIVRSPHVEAAYHLPLKPGTNVAVVTSLSHVIVTEGLYDEKFIRERCDWSEFEDWAAFVAEPQHSPEEVEKLSGVPAELIRQAARLYATGGNGAIYYGLGVTEHSQGSTTVMAIANLAMATGNIGRPGVGVNPLRGQNNVQGACDMGSFPHELPGYRHMSDDATRDDLREPLGRDPRSGAGPAHPQHARRRRRRHVQGHLHPGRGHSAVRPEHRSMSRPVLRRWNASSSTTSSSTRPPTTRMSSCRARPSSRRTEPSPMPSAASTCVRKVMAPNNGYADWEVTQKLAQAMGLDWNYAHPSEIMDEIARRRRASPASPTTCWTSEGSVQWPCNEKAPLGTPIMHIGGFVRGKGKFIRTEYVATDEKTGPRFPLLLTTGRILCQYNVGAQTTAHRQCRLA